MAGMQKEDCLAEASRKREGKKRGSRVCVDIIEVLYMSV
jgi:hypothetical protein